MNLETREVDDLDDAIRALIKGYSVLWVDYIHNYPNIMKKIITAVNDLGINNKASISFGSLVINEARLTFFPLESLHTLRGITGYHLTNRIDLPEVKACAVKSLEEKA